MIGARIKSWFNADKVRDRVKKAGIESLGHGAAVIRLTARRSIRKRKKPSQPGKPPHTRKGLLRRAVSYAVEKQYGRAVIGPDYSVAGPVGIAHEFGGRFRGQRYRQRAFMGPALMKVKDRLPRRWAASVR
jgi:hypothetical protein